MQTDTVIIHRKNIMSSVEMRKLKLNTCAFVVKILEHESFKKFMLDYINKQPTTRLVEKNDDITNTDWKDSLDNDREYVKKFCKILEPYLLDLGRELKASTYKVGNMWYQQYSNKSRHQWQFNSKQILRLMMWLMPLTA